METRICRHCEEEKSLDDFYTFIKKNGKTYQPRVCKVCMTEKTKSRKIASFYDLNDTTRALDTPGEYVSDLQRDAVGSILVALGWKLNGEKNIWYKPPLKSRNGKWNFHGIKPVKDNESSNVAKRGKYKKLEPKKPENYKPVSKYSVSLSDEKMEEIRRLRKQQNLTQKQLAERFSVSQSYIYRIIHYLA